MQPHEQPDLALRLAAEIDDQPRPIRTRRMVRVDDHRRRLLAYLLTAYLSNLITGRNVQFDLKHAGPLNVQHRQQVDRQLFGLEINLDQLAGVNPGTDFLELKNQFVGQCRIPVGKIPGNLLQRAGQFLFVEL